MRARGEKEERVPVVITCVLHGSTVDLDCLTCTLATETTRRLAAIRESS